MDFAQTMDLVAVKEHALRKRRLARVDVGDDADIADVFHGSLVNVWAGRSRQDGESMRFPAVARKRRGWWRRWRRGHRLSCPGGLQQAEGPATRFRQAAPAEAPLTPAHAETAGRRPHCLRRSAVKRRRNNAYGGKSAPSCPEKPGPSAKGMRKSLAVDNLTHFSIMKVSL